MLCIGSEKVKAGKWWKMERYCLHILILKLHTSSLSIVWYNMRAFDFWPLPIFWHVYVACWLLCWKCNLVYIYCWTMHMTMRFWQKMNLGNLFWIMQFYFEKCNFDKKWICACFLTCAFIFINKNSSLFMNREKSRDLQKG